MLYWHQREVIPLELGELIKKKRLEKGLTQEELGRLLGVQKAAVSKWEKGRVSNIGRNTLSELTRILDLSPVVFFDFSESISPDKISAAKQDLIAMIDDLPEEQVEKLLQIARTVFEK
jgi:transcriptional regulator with XRE-family HTH domain